MGLFGKNREISRTAPETNDKYSELEHKLLSGDWQGVRNEAKLLLANNKSDSIAETMLVISDLFLLGFYEIESKIRKKQGNLISTISAATVFRSWVNDLRKRHPKSAEVYFLLGTACDMLGNTKEALSAWEKAVKIKPDFVLAVSHIAATYNGLGKNMEAIEWANKAIRVRPDFVDAYIAIAHSYIGLGKLQKARDELRKCVQINPGSADAWGDLAGICSDLGAPEEAVEHAKRALDINPEHRVGLTNLANAQASLGKTDEAIKNYEKVLSITPDDPTALHNIALTLDQAGQSIKAIEWYNKLQNLGGEWLPAEYRNQLNQRIQELKRKIESQR